MKMRGCCKVTGDVLCTSFCLCVHSLDHSKVTEHQYREMHSGTAASQHAECQRTMTGNNDPDCVCVWVCVSVCVSLWRACVCVRVFLIWYWLAAKIIIDRPFCPFHFHLNISFCMQEMFTLSYNHTHTQRQQHTLHTLTYTHTPSRPPVQPYNLPDAVNGWLLWQLQWGEFFRFSQFWQ